MLLLVVDLQTCIRTPWQYQPNPISKTSRNAWWKLLYRYVIIKYWRLTTCHIQLLLLRLLLRLVGPSHLTELPFNSHHLWSLASYPGKLNTATWAWPKFLVKVRMKYLNVDEQLCVEPDLIRSKFLGVLLEKARSSGPKDRMSNYVWFLHRYFLL